MNRSTVLYYYNDVSAGNARRPFMAPDRAVFNLIYSYQKRVTKKILWKTQINLNNVTDRHFITVYPNLTTGVPDNAGFYVSPRCVVWTNTFSF